MSCHSLAKVAPAVPQHDHVLQPVEETISNTSPPSPHTVRMAQEHSIEPFATSPRPTPAIHSTNTQDSEASDAKWFVDRITIKIPHTRNETYDSSAEHVDFAAQRGECERAQLWGWDNTQARTNVRVSFSTLNLATGTSSRHTAFTVSSRRTDSHDPIGAPSQDDPTTRERASTTLTASNTQPNDVVTSTSIPATAWSWKQQGYVYANTSSHYMCSVDVIPQTGSTPPYGCGDTPAKACMTGCPADPNGTCGGGLAPRGSCNMCQCNRDGTPCPTPNWRDVHPCVVGW